MVDNSATSASSPKPKARSSTPQKSPVNKRDRIIEMLKTEASPSRIAKALKVSRQYVYDVRDALAAAAAEVPVTAKQLPWYALKASDPWGSQPKDAELFKMN